MKMYMYIHLSLYVCKCICTYISDQSWNGDHTEVQQLQHSQGQGQSCSIQLTAEWRKSALVLKQHLEIATLRSL